MGVIKHSTIVIIGWDKAYMENVLNKAKEVFNKHFGEEFSGEQLVSNLVPSIMNGDFSFFLAPDGSKEGWEQSNQGDSAREEFVEYLSKQEQCYYIEVDFGGDFNDTPEIVNKG